MYVSIGLVLVLTQNIIKKIQKIQLFLQPRSEESLKIPKKKFFVRRERVGQVFSHEVQRVWCHSIQATSPILHGVLNNGAPGAGKTFVLQAGLQTGWSYLFT